MVAERLLRFAEARASLVAQHWFASEATKGRTPVKFFTLEVLSTGRIAGGAAEVEPAPVVTLDAIA